jgi:superfamily II DNA or RNA helicase
VTPPLTKKLLIDWAGLDVVQDAESLVKGGRVLEADYEFPELRGAILHNNRPLNTSLTVASDGTAQNHCPCYTNRERGLMCTHIIAVGLTVVKRAADPRRAERYREEMRRATRLAQIDETQYITRATPRTPGALPATVRITLGSNWLEGFGANAVPMRCELVSRRHPIPLDQVPRDQAYALGKQDESLLFVLEDISEGPARGQVEMTRSDALNVIRLHAGRSIHREDASAVAVNAARLTTHLKMDLDRENGELILIAHTELPFLDSGEFPVYLVSGREGWVYGTDNLWPLENVLPLPYHSIYDEPVIVGRPDVLRFLKQEIPLLSRHTRVESDITQDLFSVDPATPSMRLRVQGSPASLSATLHACYGGIELIAAKPDAREHFAVPDQSDLMRYTVRNLPAEKAALAWLARSGLRGETGDSLADIVGTREVLNFLGSHLPGYRRVGWVVELEGRVSPFFESLDFATPVVHVQDEGQDGWFDVAFDFEDTVGTSLSAADVQLALRKGDSYLQRGGRTVLIDAEAIDSMHGVFSDCASMDGDRAGHFRMSNIYAPFVKSSLDALDGIDIEATRDWRIKADHQNRSLRVEREQLKEPLNSILRGYQHDGVAWLRFLEANGFCGLLADEMGLGKTLQALAWIEMARSNEEIRGRPALVVCPTSLVDNWAEEAARFAPSLSVVTVSGSDRHAKWEQVPKADVAVTSYALLRRDIDRYLEIEFAVAILDEAQHIKNRSTRNAVAAKQIRASHRLVLTGTPVENSVADLWSIMDFLMPGYLASHQSFRQSYELAIARGGPDAELAQTRLRRKLHPFLLRRLKREVAKDLPPKIEKISFCHLTSDQRTVYTELLKSSQRKISGLVSSKGFNRSRMEILTTLMRLRQICCHIDLLKLPDLKPEHPSAKMDLFFELLNEAMDSEHRILVFSQFVTMLHILRDELTARNVSFCYLDGSTQERMKVVHRFNTQRDIPVFLISLKAGGTGLNLTGADMVIHFDPWWNPAVEDQATDRAYRIGQSRTVYSVKMITRDTVEEKVLELQRRKKAVINATIESDEGMIQSLSWDDVQELLSL